jgi:hypothetical protein
METTLAALFYKIPKVRLVWCLLRLELAHMSGLAIVTGLAGSGRILPSGLAALAYRQNMIQSGRSIGYRTTTVLASVLISQEDVTL